ncbi:hypothetical protein Vadar_021697 [Vaccinium darrowii]|uniref:Uncharacterized protein n=1 Tax=Vaccinium darrowii TaxID=229202 RepID=A0ACB7XBA8_9ERIC|nr:hypothetical protein Vadar_021697 [Vaccinium darrowii]
MGKVRALEKELGDAWVQEERYWRQKARVSWMVEGDRNTSFYHAKVTQRRKRNAIAGIQDSNGVWYDDPEKIAQEFVNYFHHLFQAEGTDHVPEVVDTIKARVDEQMNNSLTRMVSASEIRQAVFDIDPHKALAQAPTAAGKNHMTSKRSCQPEFIGLYVFQEQKPAIEPLLLPTPSEIWSQDIWNNCAVRNVFDGVVGLFMKLFYVYCLILRF